MTFRSNKKMTLIVDTIIKNKDNDWNASTQKEVRTDAIRLLESLIAEYGIEAACKAMENQGFSPASNSTYNYFIQPLFEEAIKRRTLFEEFKKAP